MGTRSIIRILLPALYNPHQRHPEVTADLLQLFYEQVLRPAVLEVREDLDGDPHWVDWQSLFKKLRDRNGTLRFTTQDVPPDLLPALGSSIIRRCRHIASFKGAFFLHEFRGYKGATWHSAHHYFDAVRAREDFLSVLDMTLIKKEDWLIDLAFEIGMPGHTVFLKTNAHRRLMRFILPNATNAELRAVQTGGKFLIDHNAQLLDISGFRSTTGRAGYKDNVKYMNVYTTDSQVTYQLHRGLYERIRPYQLLDADSRVKVIEAMEKIYGMYYTQGENKTPCSVRVEFRVSLEVDDIAEWPFLPSDVIERCFIAQPARDYWYNSFQ
ncbi:hypothetical protein C8J56DRAFT_805749 [Mycena floridula]|nr:hypothetical protein C8J56DRAFT_810575 [Mycena floridula]KAJ7572988.1 hypothetical protein C8J56DRAFT_805749 [Mycena floridula]